jgi:hypothetical protein
MHEVVATQSMDFADYHSLVQQRAAQPAQPLRKRPHLLARWVWAPLSEMLWQGRCVTDALLGTLRQESDQACVGGRPP